MLLNRILLAQADAAGAQLRNFLDLFTTPVGLIGLTLLIALTFVLMAAPRWRWLVVGLLLYASTLSFTEAPWFKPVLMFPLEQIRYQGRGLTMGLMFALLLPALTAARGWRTRLILAATWAFFAFEVLFSFRVLVGGQRERAIFGLMIYVLTLSTLAVGIARWLQDVTDVHRLLRGIAFGAGLFVLGTAMQLLRDRSQVIWQGRLFGVTGNPQHFALAAALFLGPLCYLVVQRTEPVLWRVFSGAVAGVLVIFLIWTGSRTGALMAAVQFLLLFRLRLGRLAALAIVVGIFVLLGLQWFSEGLDSASRLVSTENTRRLIWQELLEEFARHPILGAMGQELGGGESSYLTVAARLGLFGLIPLAVTFTLAVAGAFQLRRVKRHLANYKLLADMVTASMGCLAVGALFEAYLIGMISVAVCFVYIDLALLAFLIDYGKAMQHHAGEQLTQEQWEQQAYQYEHAS
jgi:hypothetical protein